jgi:hypothetical protein
MLVPESPLHSDSALAQPALALPNIARCGVQLCVGFTWSHRCVSLMNAGDPEDAPCGPPRRRVRRPWALAASPRCTRRERRSARARTAPRRPCTTRPHHSTSPCGPRGCAASARARSWGPTCHGDRPAAGPLSAAAVARAGCVDPPAAQVNSRTHRTIKQIGDFASYDATKQRLR